MVSPTQETLIWDEQDRFRQSDAVRDLRIAKLYIIIQARQTTQPANLVNISFS